MVVLHVLSCAMRVTEQTECLYKFRVQAWACCSQQLFRERHNVPEKYIIISKSHEATAELKNAVDLWCKKGQTIKDAPIALEVGLCPAVSFLAAYRRKVGIEAHWCRTWFCVPAEMLLPGKLYGHAQSQLNHLCTHLYNIVSDTESPFSIGLKRDRDALLRYLVIDVAEGACKGTLLVDPAAFKSSDFVAVRSKLQVPPAEAGATQHTWVICMARTPQKGNKLSSPRYSLPAQQRMHRRQTLAGALASVLHSPISPISPASNNAKIREMLLLASRQARHQSMTQIAAALSSLCSSCAVAAHHITLRAQQPHIIVAMLRVQRSLQWTLICRKAAAGTVAASKWRSAMQREWKLSCMSRQQSAPLAQQHNLQVIVVIVKQWPWQRNSTVSL